ncbi:hypothetical protein [Stutzerimonas xanthomarina]|uniref:hypothetical protein n=1 Tax=Stutzerimonas xanthomarina TaxID=271420 RepID=UPI003AA8F870
MELDEIAVNYYYESLALAQKSLISGITISAVAYLVAISGIGKSSYSIPFIGIEVESLSYFSISLLCLYFACGMLCMHGMEKADTNWKLVSDADLSARLLQTPNILMAKSISKAFLYGGLFMVGALLSAKILNLEGWRVSIVGSIVSAPYFLALRTSAYFKKPSPHKSTDNPN